MGENSSIIYGIIIGAIIGSLYTGIRGEYIIRENYRKPMDALGIERFKKCAIDTQNCHSNWYEIVYKDKLNGK